MKKYDTPYGKKTAGLLMLAMDSHTREIEASELIQIMARKLKEYAPTDSSHEGLENCDLIVKANNWIENRKNQIKNTTEKLI